MANPVSTTNKATEWRPSSDPKNLTPTAAGNLLASIKAEKVKGKPDQERYFDLVGRAENAAGHLAREINAAYNHISNEGREMLASETRSIREMEASAEMLEKAIAEWHTLEPPLAGLAGPSSGPTNYAEGKPLSTGQSFYGFASVRASARGEEMNGPLDLDKFLRGALTGSWRGAENEQRISNAMSGTSSAAGGILIPTLLSSQIIDMARAQTRVLQAGAQIVPMESRTVDVPRWTQDPALAWRTENAIVGESDATVDKVTLDAKSLATVVKVSRELVEDTDISGALAAAFASALAAKLDQAALYADGTNGAPLGIKADSNVTKTSMGPNGASFTSWDQMVDAVGRLRDNNEEPTAVIMADRTARGLAKLKATGSGEYLSPPSYLDGLPRMATSGVPTNLTVGTSIDCTDVFTGDWRQLMFGIRTDLQITLLSERYMTNDAAGSPAGGQYGFVAWWRGDIQAARAKAFGVITGVRG